MSKNNDFLQGSTRINAPAMYASIVAMALLDSGQCLAAEWLGRKLRSWEFAA